MGNMEPVADFIFLGSKVCTTSLSFLAVAVAALLCVCLLLHQVLQAWTDVCAGSFKAHTGVVCGMQWITPVVPSCFGLSF